MAQKKAYEVAGWIARPDRTIAIVLIYGPDRGLVSEHARAFALSTGIDLNDAFSVTRLEADESDEPGRLVYEALTVPMFASRRLLWVRNVGAHKAIAEDVKALCADLPADVIVLIEAGELKKGSTLRSAVEQAPVAMALPCYADEARDLDRIIDEVLGNAGVRITLEARNSLKRNLGGDRLATRSEIDKLALYAGKGSEIDVADVEALTGDMSERSVDDVVDAALSGRLADFDLAFQRHIRQGGQAFLVLSSMLRQLQQLHNLRAVMERGPRSASAAVAEARPPVFFARRKLVESVLERSTVGSLERGMARIHMAVLQTRQRAELAEALTRQACLGIAVEAARSARDRRAG